METLTTAVITPDLPTGSFWLLLGEWEYAIYSNLMTPSKVEKLETLTVVSPVTSFILPPLHSGRCVSCIMGASAFSVD